MKIIPTKKLNSHVASTGGKKKIKKLALLVLKNNLIFNKKNVLEREGISELHSSVFYVLLFKY